MVAIVLLILLLLLLTGGAFVHLLIPIAIVGLIVWVVVWAVRRGPRV